MIERVDWYGCYDGSWTGNLIPAAFAHPAKAPFALAERIYRHMLTEGWLRPGDRVIDPFGGVGCLAFHALVNGLHYDGVELEPKFHALAQENLALWASRYAGKLPRWGTARVHLGDSRNLAQIVGAANASVSSPPYEAGVIRERSGELEADRLRRKGVTAKCGLSGNGDHPFNGYGNTAGNLGNLSGNDFDAALTSPPYAETRIDGNGEEGASGLRMPDGSFARGTVGWELRKAQGGRYGDAAGNLGHLPAGDFDASVASPPYAGKSQEGHVTERDERLLIRKGREDLVARLRTEFRGSETYGTSDGQLGAQISETFWQSARMIVEQTYSVLKPGAVAAWITGDYVRNKRRVPFGEQWLALCEAVGFEPLLWAVAWKTQDGGTQYDIEGNAITRRRDRVSFFRRLANAQNPDAAILNEDVIFVRRP